MSSSYRSLDWVLSHWAHFTVHRFICVYVFVFCIFLFVLYVLYYCNMVVWAWWDLSLILRTLSYFSPLTLLVVVGSFEPLKTSSIMCLMGTLNLTRLQLNLLCSTYDHGTTFTFTVNNGTGNSKLVMHFRWKSLTYRENASFGVSWHGSRPLMATMSRKFCVCSNMSYRQLSTCGLLVLLTKNALRYNRRSLLGPAECRALTRH